MATETVNITTTLANDSVTNAKLANMAQGTIKMRAAGAGTGDPIDGTPDQASTVLDAATDPFVRTSNLPAGGGDVVGPASSTNNNIPQWDGITGKLLKNGLGKSTGGNGAADGGKLVEFQGDGNIYFSNNATGAPSISALSSGTGDGVNSQSDSGDAFHAVSIAGKGLHAINTGSESAVHANAQGTGHALEAEQNGGANDIALFHDGTGNGMVVKTDGGLDWTSATGAQTTRTNLGVIADGDTLAVGLTFPNNGFFLTEEGGGANTVQVRIDEVLSLDRRLNITLNDADRTVGFPGDGQHSGTNTGDQDLSGYATTAAVAAGYQPLDGDLTAIAGLTPSNDDVIQRKAGAWTNRTVAQYLADQATGIRGLALTGLSLATSQVIAATDTLLQAFGYLQAQITTLTTWMNRDVTTRITSDFTTTSTTLVDVTGGTCAMEASKDYVLDLDILVQSSATTTGLWLSLNGPASPTLVVFSYAMVHSLVTNTIQRLGNNGYDSGSTGTDMPAANTTYHVKIHGIVRNGVNAGNLQLRLAAENANTVRVMTGTFLKITKTN